MQSRSTAVLALLCVSALVAVGVWSQRSSSPSNAVALLQDGTEQLAQTEMLTKSRFVDRVWLYDGHNVNTRKGEPFMKRLIRRHHYQTKVEEFYSLRDAPLRAVLWSEAEHVMVFPPFSSYPGLTKVGKTDLRAYVAAGNNVVFTGSYLAIEVLNDIFGFQLQEDYKNGPFYRNDRNVRQTPFAFLPERLNEVGATFGVKSRYLPPGGRSIYDTLGCSTVFYVRYDLGTIVYIGFSFDTPFHIDNWVKTLHAAVAL